MMTKDEMIIGFQAGRELVQEFGCARIEEIRAVDELIAEGLVVVTYAEQSPRGEPARLIKWKEVRS